MSAKILVGVMSKTPTKVPVIGVVANAHDLGVETESEPEIYAPGFGAHAVLLVRSTADPESVTSIVRDVVRGLDARQPIYHVESLDGLLADSLARQRMTAVLLGMFSFVALALAAIGIYGVLSYLVVQRTREIGLRMAVGANREDIIRMVMGQAGRFTAVGIVVGLAAALTSARLISGLLFQTRMVDPLSVSITACGLAVVAMLAVCVPAARAASVNPTEALRAE